jgi:Tol biopolymer transport system component
VPRDGGVPNHVVDAQVLDALTWSPDGREIAFAAPDGDVPHLFRVAVTGGTPQRIVTPGPAVAPSWSASKNLIAYLESRRAPDAAPNIAHVILITPEGRVAGDFISQTPSLSNGLVAWSHDGRYLAGYSDPGGALGSLWVVDVDRQSAQLVIELPPDRRFRGVTWSPGNDRIIFGVQQQISDLVLFDQAR